MRRPGVVEFFQNPPPFPSRKEFVRLAAFRDEHKTRRCSKGKENLTTKVEVATLSSLRVEGQNKFDQQTLKSCQFYNPAL